MAGQLVRLQVESGTSVYVHPNRVTMIGPVIAVAGPDGITARSFIHVAVPHVAPAGNAPLASIAQAWDTVSLVVVGTPEQVKAEIWPREAASA